LLPALVDHSIQTCREVTQKQLARLVRSHFVSTCCGIGRSFAVVQIYLAKDLASRAARAPTQTPTQTLLPPRWHAVAHLKTSPSSEHRLLGLSSVPACRRVVLRCLSLPGSLDPSRVSAKPCTAAMPLMYWQQR